MREKLLLEDNKGGDFVEITKLDDNLIAISTGQSCVYSFDCIMPVSLLAGMFSHLTMLYGNPLQIAEEIFKDNQKWLAEITPQIKGMGLFDNFDYKTQKENK